MLAIISLVLPRLFPRCVLGIAAMLAMPCVAHAEPAGVERADALFQEGRAAVRQGNWEKACPDFAESLNLDPAPGTRINLGECEERANHLVSAFELYERAARELAPEDPRLPIARMRAAAVDARVPRLIVPSSVTVRVDGDPTPRRGEIRLDPGRHALVVLDSSERSYTFVLAASERYTVAPKAPPEAVQTSQAMPARRVAGYAIGGSGVAAIATGLVLGALTLHDKNVVGSDCDAAGACSARGLEAKSEGRTLSTISTVAVGVGVLALAAGIYLVLKSPPAVQSGLTRAFAELGGLNVRF